MKNPTTFLISLLICTLAQKTIADSGYDPTNDLLAAFGSRCKGHGSIDSAAISDSENLISVIESIKRDPNCDGIKKALYDLEPTLSVAQLQRSRFAEFDQEEAAAAVNEIEFAIQAEQARGNDVDEIYLGALKQQLVTEKVNLAKAKKFPNQESLRRRFESIGNIQVHAANIFRRLESDTKCTEKHSNLGAQIGAQFLGIASSFGSGLVGSLVLSTAGIADNFISYVQDHNLSSQIKSIVNDKLGEAVGCAVEGLASTYCKTRDIETIISQNKKTSEYEGKNESWQNGVDAVGKEMQAYVEWVNQIDAGSPATSLGRSKDKKDAFTLQNDLKSVKSDLEGTYTSGLQTVAKAIDKKKATFSVLNDLASKISPTNCYSSPTGPCPGASFTRAFVSDTGCGPYIYFFSGGTTRVRKSGDQGTKNCAQYITEEYPNPPEINDVRGLIENIVTEATLDVNQQVSQVNESNPNLVLAQVDSKKDNRRSAREFLQTSRIYLENLLADPKSIAIKPTQKKLINSTNDSIKKTLDLIDRTTFTPAPTPDNPNPLPIGVEPVDNLNEIAKELIPSGDIFAIPKALIEIVNQDIDQKIGSGEIDENLATLMQLSANDSLGELIKFYIGLEPASLQAAKAKDLTKTNLKSLVKIFDEPLEKRMKNLDLEAKSDPDSAKLLSMLCMQTLSIPSAPQIGKNFNASKYCKGRTYTSIYEGSGIDMSYDKLIEKAFPDRVCSVYDFYRKSHLYSFKSKDNRSRKIKKPAASEISR